MAHEYRPRRDSAVPRWVRVSVGLFATLMIFPFVFALILPMLLVIPLAAPFVFSVFVGDFRAQRRAARELVRDYAKMHPERFWYTPAVPKSGYTH